MSHIYLNCIYYGCKCQEQMQVLSIVLIIQLKILLFSLCFFQNISQRPIFSYLFTEVHGFFFRQKIALFGHFPLNHILFLKPSRNKNFSKAKLLQLNGTQFPSLEIFVIKKVGNKKKQYVPLLLYQFKGCMLGGLSFLEIQLFY